MVMKISRRESDRIIFFFHDFLPRLPMQIRPCPPHFFMADPSVRGRLIDARNPQAPDALLRQLRAEGPSALEARPGGLYLARGGGLLEGVP